MKLSIIEEDSLTVGLLNEMEELLNPIEDTMENGELSKGQSFDSTRYKKSFEYLILLSENNADVV